MTGALPDAEPASILIADDDEDCQHLYGVYLRHLGYHVLGARDGLQAVEMAKRRMPSVIVMDVAMPRLDGVEATILLKAHLRTSHLPVLILSAYADREVFERARAAGADVFLTKPCSPHDLTAEVVRALSGDLPQDIDRRSKGR